MEDNPCKTVFNFYEKITPPANFATFVEGWRHLGNYVESIPHYVGALLHKNVDPNGLYPYVNFATFKGDTVKIMTDMTSPTPELIQALIEGHGLPGHQINYPGGYVETVTDSNQPIAPDLADVKDGSVFVIIAFQVPPNSNDDLSSFESRWYDHVSLQRLQDLSSNNGQPVVRYGFYKRFTPYEPFHSFMYVVRCEIRGFTGSEKELTDVISNINAQPLPNGISARNASIYKVAERSVGKSANLSI